MTQYHEPTEELTSRDRDIVRALASVKEEIEAVDWYHQRAMTTTDDELKALLIHNRDEEIEHVVMALEWLRKRMPEFQSMLKEYLFQDDAPPKQEGEDEPLDHPAPGRGLNIGSITS